MAAGSSHTLARWSGGLGVLLRRLADGRVMPIALGLVLILAAFLKTHQLATEELRERTVLTSRWFMTAMVLYETALGLGLVVGLAPGVLRWVAIATFAVFFEVSLYQGIMGYGRCGCLGRVTVSPWLMLAVDCVALTALVLWQPRATPRWWAFDARRGVLWAVFYVCLIFPLLMHIVYYAPSGIMYSLRNDERLREFVTLDYSQPPSLEELLRVLEEATGLPMKVHPRLGQDASALGPLKARNIPVWSVMENLALKQTIPARWDRVGGGYELRPAAPLGHEVVPWLLSAVVAGGAMGLYWYRTRQGLPPAGASPGERRRTA